MNFTAGPEWIWLVNKVLSCLNSIMQVRALLESLPQEKWVFTNCNEKHARSALQLLSIEVRTQVRVVMSPPCACVSASTDTHNSLHDLAESGAEPEK